MDPQHKHSHCLKDISNLTRKLGSVFPPNMAALVNPDDKENADPRSSNGLKDQVLLATTKKPSSVEQDELPRTSSLEAESVSDASSDGFEVNDDLQLDDEPSDEDNELGDDENLDKTKVMDTSKDNEDPQKEAPSPLIMSSLLNSRVVFKIDGDDEDNGASPMFAQPGEPTRQERRKLDFNNLDTTSPISSSQSSSNQQQTRKLFRRSISMVERGQKLQLTTVTSSPDICSPNTMTSPLSRPFASFKRPNAPLQPLSQNLPVEAQQPSKKLKRGLSLKMPAMSSLMDSPILAKSMSTSNLDSPQIAKPMLQLSLSESEANIKKACSLADVPNLTGDRSRPLCLPTIPTTGGGRNSKNLVSVDCHTVADLIKGNYEDKVASFRIVDARYCYEFKGGHIRGAENFGSWDEDAFFNEFLPKNLGPKKAVPEAEDKANILIFHCEFSSARGPALMALLRKRYIVVVFLLHRTKRM